MSFFKCFFRNHENSQAKNPVNGKQTFLKKCLFWRFFEKSDRTNFFFGNGLIEPKNWWKAPYRIVDIPYKTQKRHFSTETVIFGQKKSACGKPPAEENGPFPGETLFGTKKKRLRQAANRGKWSCSWRSASRQKFKQKSRKKRGGGTHDLAILRSESHENCFVALTFRDGSF